MTLAWRGLRSGCRWEPKRTSRICFTGTSETKVNNTTFTGYAETGKGCLHANRFSADPFQEIQPRPAHQGTGDNETYQCRIGRGAKERNQSGGADDRPEIFGYQHPAPAKAA